MNKSLRFAIAVAAAFGFTTAASAQTVEGLLGRIPESANFVAVVNNRAILQSPRAVREGWSKLREFEYLAGAIPVPPTVPLAVMGSEVEPGDLTGNWSCAAFTMSVPTSMKAIAERNGGRVETIDDYPVAITPRFGYMIKLTEDVYGVMMGAGRQPFYRWVKSRGNSRKPAVSDYLKQIASDAKDYHVSIAVDLDNLVDPAALRARLSMLKCLAGKSKDEVAALEKLLMGMEGMRINVKIGESSRTHLRLDFKNEIGKSRELLKPCLNELAGAMGVAIAEFAAAEWEFESKSAVLSAELSDGSLARLMTLALMPMYAMDQAPVGGGAAEVELIATRRYYRAIATLLDLLNKQNQKAVDYTQTAMWHESFAARINQLPQDGVDPYMGRYGYNTANKLRTLSASLRGVPVKTAAAAAGLDVKYSVMQTGSARVYYRGWRTVPVYGALPYTNVADVLAKQAEAIAKDTLDRDKVWSELEEDRRQIRQLMLEKYKVDFDAIK